MRILLLEDNPADAELVECKLRESLPDFILKRVETEEEFLRELAGFLPDLILSDYDLPGYDGMTALAQARARCPDIPFILVTGAISEDLAIETLTRGASDYVLKNRINRLVPVVRRVLGDAEEQQARRKAEQEYRAASLYARSLIEANLDPMITISIDGEILDVNAAAEEISGHPRSRLIGTDASQYFTEPDRVREGLRMVLSEGSVRDFPLRVIHASGRTTEILCNASIYLDIDGKVAGVFVAGRDITVLRRAEEALRIAHDTMEDKVRKRTSKLKEEIRERKKIEKDLRDREEKLGLALDAAGQGIWEVDLEKDTLAWSEQSKALFGVEAATSITRELFYNQIHPDDRNRVRQAVSDAVNRNKKYEIEMRILKPKGGYRWIVSSGRVFRDDKGKPVRMLGMIREITERKQMEVALGESERKYRNLVKYAPAGICQMDIRTGRFTSVNDLMCEFSGYTRDELLEMDPADLLDEESKIKFRQRFAARIAGEKLDDPVEYTVRTKNGRKIFIRLDVKMIHDENGELKGATGVCYDMTERRLMEEALKKSEKRYRELIKYAPAAVYEADFRTGKYINVNDTMCELTGFSREELLKMGPMDLLDGNEKLRFRKRMERWLLGEKPDENVEYRIKAKDGRTIYVILNVRFLSDESGRPKGAAVVAYDITERKLMEEALKESEKRYRELVKYAPAAVYEIDFRTRKFINVNDFMCEQLGYAREELLNMEADALLDETSKVVFRERAERWLSGEKSTESVEYKVRAKDGQERYALLRVSFTADENGNPQGATIVGYDVTERKLAEEELKRTAERLLAVNRELESFTYSVSHDLKGPLRVMDGFARMILKDYAASMDPELKRRFDVIKDSARNMSGLIDGLLSLSRLRREEMHFSHLNMKEKFQKIWEDIRRENPSRQIEFVLGQLPHAFGDSQLIRQVVYNLLANAVKFTARRKKALIEVAGHVEDGHAVYSIKDNGAGFDMNYYDRLFGVFQRLHHADDFQGTGIGLALVQRIIHRHGGRVWAEGTPGKGAVFYFSLPRRQNQVEEKNTDLKSHPVPGQAEMDSRGR